MAEPVLSVRDLNRALLARQMLLAREETTVPGAVTRLVGLNDYMKLEQRYKA